MTYRGQFKNGVVVFDEPPAFPDGATVEVTGLAHPVAEKGQVDNLPPWSEVLKDFIGKAKGLPSDMAENHDHYIHGTRKR